MGAGAICLGLTFARLARLAPATGGPYAYTRLAYGDFPGFLIAWGYWISIWASLPVIAVALAGAVVDLFPILRMRSVIVILTLGAIWVVVLINLRGVKAAGLMAEVTTYAKLVPFGAVALIGLLYIDTSHFSEFNPSGQPLLQATAALAPLTMFAFLGLESATVPAGDVRDPERTIPRSTVLGITIAATLYVFGTIVVMGVLPRQQLVQSLAPFSDAAYVMWGRAGQISIAIAVILSSIGALNGWTLLMGQVPMAAARDGLFPPLFSRLSGRNVPAIGIVVSAALATLLILVQAIGAGGFRGDLQSNRRTEHDGCRHPLCLLRIGRQPGLGPRQRRHARSPCHCRRARGLRIRHVHALWLRRRAGPLRTGPVAARNSRVRMATPTYRACCG